MVHSADDLRSHVSWSATGLLRIAFFPFASHSEVSNSEVAVLFKNQILGFEVSMDDSFGMDVLKAEHYTPCHEFWLEK